MLENKTTPFFELVGNAGLKFCNDVFNILNFIGEFGTAFLYALRRPHKVRWRDTFYYMDRCGSDALPIISLTGFLVGMILAFQAIVQLQQYGVDVFVIDLVGVVMVKELGPLMVAVIMAGRAGSAFAAEIGTMKVSEEIEALTTMGFSTSRFLIVPKVLGLVTVMPLITIFANIMGAIGGIFIAYINLGMAIPSAYNRLITAITPMGITQGLVKALVFAFIVSSIGCMRGIQAESNARGVGEATTSAVVTGIFLIIIADFVLTALFCMPNFQ